MITITILSVLLILYGIVGLLNKFIKFEWNYKEMRLPYWTPSLVTGIFFFILTSLIIKIDAQDAGVVVTPNGVSSEELHTGWHVVAPWNNVFKMDKTVWVYTCAQSVKEGAKPNADAIWAPTKDGIKMGFDVSVSWRIVADEASWIYSNISENDGGNTGRYLWLEENVIRPKLKSAMALSVSNYTPIEAYSTKREDIQRLIFQRMSKDVKGYKLIIEQVDMREVFYNHDFEKAINAKKLAEQEVLRLVEVTRQKAEELKQAEINKNISIEQAKGDAEALKIKGDALAKNPKMIELEWINTWDGKLPTYMMGNGQSVMLNLNNQ